MYLGKVVGSGEVCPIGAKVEAIVNFGALTSWCGRLESFCRNVATVAAPDFNRPFKLGAVLLQDDSLFSAG